MRTAISATDAVRHFSELLNNIKYRGESYTVIRGGKPAAALVPVQEACRDRTLGELAAFFKSLPRLDRSDTSFAADVKEAAASQPPLPEPVRWD